jgi:hypothetical protein
MSFSNSNRVEAQRDAQGFLSLYMKDRSGFELVFHDEDELRDKRDVWSKPVIDHRDRIEVEL